MTLPVLERIASQLGTRFVGSPVAPGTHARALKPVRVGLWDRYGGSMPSGWTRWLLEQFEIPFTVIYPQTIDAGVLAFGFILLQVSLSPTRCSPATRRCGRRLRCPR